MAVMTEDSVNDLVAQFLRAEYDIDILTQVSARIPRGRRKPDFQLTDEKSYKFYGEGEWQDKFSDGYDQAIEFGDIPDASGYFLIGYHRDISKKGRRKAVTPQDIEAILTGKTYWGRFKRENHPVSRFSGQLRELCDWLKSNLKGMRPEEKPEAFLSFVPSLIEAIAEVMPGELEKRLGYEPFMALMGSSETSIPPEVLREAAAYILLDQIVFHRILANRGLRPIDPDRIKKPTDIQSYFEEVLKINYQPIFSINVLSILSKKAVPVLRKVIRIVNEDQPESLSGDILGNMWHTLIPLELRKPIAAYYTNVMAARLLANLTIRSSEDKVADFACGSGTLLVAAYERKRKLLNHEMTKIDHERFLKQLMGVDVMAFSAHLAVVQLALRNPVWKTDEVRISIQDSTILKPGMKIKPFQEVWPKGQRTLTSFHSQDDGGKMKEGALSGTMSKGHEFILEPFDVILMNPPFTRQERIPDWLKKDLPNRFESYRKYLDGQMGFGGYFVFLADRFLGPGGRIGFVLPSTVLRLNSYEGVRKMLIDRNFDVEYVITTDARSAFSESTAFREMLLVARKLEKNEKPGATQFINLTALPKTEEESSRLAEEIANGPD